MKLDFPKAVASIHLLNKKHLAIIGSTIIAGVFLYHAIYSQLLSFKTFYIDIFYSYGNFANTLFGGKEFAFTAPNYTIKLKHIGLIVLIFAFQRYTIKKFAFIITGFCFWIFTINITRMLIHWHILSSSGSNPFIILTSAYLLSLYIYPLLFIRKDIIRQFRHASYFKSILYAIPLFFIGYHSIRLLSIVLHPQKLFIYDILTSVILNISIVFLKLVDFDVTLANNAIADHNTTIGMAHSCIGFKLMLFFCLVIFISNGEFWHKLTYSIIGLAVLICLNAFRITLLFIYVDANGSSNNSFGDHHEIFNKAIYAALIILWGFWFFFVNNKNNFNRAQRK